MTTEMSSTEDIIGRTDINDFEAILSVLRAPRWPTAPRRRLGLRRHLHLGLREGRPAQARQAVREGQDVAVERRDGPALGDRGRPGGAWSRPTPPPTAGSMPGPRPHRHPLRESGGTRSGSHSGSRARTGRSSQFMHGEQGALVCTAKIVEIGAVDRRRVLRLHPGDGRGPPRGGLRKYLDDKLSGHYPINAHLGLLLDDIIADNRWDMTYLGHADHGGGPGPGRLRLHAPDDHRAAAQAAAALRDVRRGPPCRLRGPQPPGVLRPARRRPRSASARSSPSRRPCACATGSSSRRCGTGWA